jgi:hypothetical protein
MSRKSVVLAFCAAACLTAPILVWAQTADQKPPPAAEKKSRPKAEKPDTPPIPRREAPRTGPGEERPRSDVPVSFPVDI